VSILVFIDATLDFCDKNKKSLQKLRTADILLKLAPRAMLSAAENTAAIVK